jgi:hypothetical protein
MATSKTPRERAEACYAVARSTTHEGERAAAIGRGDAICEREGLDPASFDVPGRARPASQRPPDSRYTDDLFRRPKAPGSYSRDDINDTMRRYHEGMRRAATEQERQRDAQAAAAQAARDFQRAAERAAQETKAFAAAFANLNDALRRARERTGANPNEAPADAARRNFEAATAAARTRDNARLTPDTAAAELWAIGVRVYPADVDRSVWLIELEGALTENTPGELVELARIARKRVADLAKERA